MYKKISLTFFLAMALLVVSGTALFADNTITLTDTDPQVGTEAKGTFMKAILLDSTSYLLWG